MVTQTWEAQKYQKHADFVSKLGMPVVELLDPKPHETILDLGCGNGTIAHTLNNLCHEVIGIDFSADMVAAARELGVDAMVMDGENITLNSTFDAVFSNAALHWMLHPENVLQGVNRVLRDGGRFVGEFGGEGNVTTILEAMETIFSKHPEFGSFTQHWYFPSCEDYTTLLQKNGFNVEYIELIPRSTPIDDISNWIDVFGNGMMANLNREQKEQLKYEVREYLKSKLYSDETGWSADYIRLRFKAVKL